MALNPHPQGPATIVHAHVLWRDSVLSKMLEARRAEGIAVSPFQMLAKAGVLASMGKVTLGDRGEVFLERRLWIAQPP